METKEHSKIQKLMKSKPAKAGVSVALVGTLALAGIGAYFTGTDTVENKFDISAGLTDKITVVEENWDTTDADDNGIPDAAEHVVPLQTLAKDPVIKNESDVEAWLFCQIKVPTANVSVVGEDGTPEAAASHEQCSIEMPEQEKLTLLTRISGKPVYGYFSEKLSPVPIA